MIKNLITSQMVRYLFFGVLTTLVNIGAFLLFTSISIDYKIANTIAWIVSVLFAYITNKWFVFAPSRSDKGGALKEFLFFLKYRFFSYIIDILAMVVLIDVIHVEESTSKIIVNILVIVFNYIASKYIIFKTE